MAACLQVSLKACSRSFLRRIRATFSVRRGQGPEVLGGGGGAVRISPASGVSPPRLSPPTARSWVAAWLGPAPLCAPTGGTHPLLEGVLPHGAAVCAAEEAGGITALDGGVHGALPRGGGAGPGRLAAPVLGQPWRGPAGGLVCSGEGLPVQLGDPY